MLAKGRVTAPTMRRHASMRAVGMQPRNVVEEFRGPRVLSYPKAKVVSAMWRAGATSGGVDDHGTYDEDDPETWEVLTLSR
jgi:hypothetical protein